MTPFLPSNTRFPKRVQLQMLNYFLAAQRKNSIYYFSSLEITDEAQQWLLQEVGRFQQIYGINADVLISALQDWGFDPTESTVETLREIEKERGNRLRNFFREQKRRQEEVHSLNPPIQIIPQSLHPIKLAA